MENFFSWDPQQEGFRVLEEAQPGPGCRRRQLPGWDCCLARQDRVMLRFLALSKPQMFAQGWRDIGLAWGGRGLEKTGGQQTGESGGWDIGGWDLGYRNEESIGILKTADMQAPCRILNMGIAAHFII